MSESDLILCQREGACLTVTLNRPQKANALTSQMLRDLRDAFLAAAQDETLRVVILTGAGERVFCAGADLTTLHDETDGPDPWEDMAQALRAIPVPTLAAINGPCMGGGLTLALACDMRICVDAARFAYPVLKNKVLPAQYDVDRLKALVGPGRAAAILLGGTTVSAAEAAAWGLVDLLVAGDVLAQTCHDLCAPALAADAAHLKTLKALLKKGPS